MANKNSLMVVAIAMLSGIVCSLITVIALRPDPWANLDTAFAGSQSGNGSSAADSEIVAVPLAKDNGTGQYLCVIAKTSHKSMIPEAGTKDEWMMVVYDMKGDELQIRAIRPIEYELQGRLVYGNGGICEPRKTGKRNDLESKELATNLTKE
ncbi:MAG: hypothetical protein AB7K09_01325 [Planctomycetota bacterium]